MLCDAEKDVKRVHLVLLFMDYDATSKDDVMGRLLSLQSCGFGISVAGVLMRLLLRFHPD